MANVKLITDSGSDLPLSFFHDNDISFIPLRVHLNDKEYEDLVTIQSKVIFASMREGKAPKTSQATPNDIKHVFEELAKTGVPGIYIAFSSELSGTYQTAVAMQQQVLEEYPDLDLTIIDSKCASLGLGLAVMHAVELVKNGASKEEVIKEVTFYCNHMEHLFTVDNLEYLARGGRISRTSAFVGGLLNIKPLLNVEDGKLVPLEKHRGRKKLFNRIIELMKERGAALGNQIVGISHGDDEATVEEIKQMMKENLGVDKFYVNMIGSAIGSHAGPGTIAIFFLNEIPNTN